MDSSDSSSSSSDSEDHDGHFDRRLYLYPIAETVAARAELPVGSFSGDSSSSSSSSDYEDEDGHFDRRLCPIVETVAAPVALKPELIPEDMICSICMTLPLEPVLTPCEHVFCKLCIYQALDGAKQCPIDRTACALDQLQTLRGLVHRLWTNIDVKCGNHINGCSWTGSIGDYAKHMGNCRFVEKLEDVMKKLKELQAEYDRLNDENNDLHERNDQLEKDFKEGYTQFELLKKRLDSVEFRNATLEQEKICREASIAYFQASQNQPEPQNLFGGTYNFKRENVVQLSQLISGHLEQKPHYIESNRIFNCVQSCYIALQRGYSDNPKNYRANVKMLLAICEASSMWFSDRQQDNFKRWYQEQF